MTRLSALFGVFFALGVSAPASAHGEWVAPPSVSVSLVCGGSPCDEVGARGQRWVIAEYGQRYAIALTNHSDTWVEVVIAVDGRSVTDGARIGSGSRGYLIAPRDRLELEGWRVNMEEVAAFRFTSVGDSYAGRVRDASAVGQVRVDVYPERRTRAWVPPPEPRPSRWLEDERPAPSSSESSQKSHARREDDGGQNLGTQYGETREQRVVMRDFERGARTQSLTLRYDDRRGLTAKGVLGPTWRAWDERRDERWVPPPPVRIDD